jgi:hypothetical protein
VDLRRQIIDALGDEALTHQELAARIDAPPIQVRRLVQLAPTFTTIGERIAYLPALLDGTTWVVPVDADDAASDLEPGGFMRMRPHLAVIGWWLIDDEVPAFDADGTELGTLTTDGVMLDGVDTDIVTCVPGWLDDVAGGWAAFTVHDGAITIAPAHGPPAPTAAQAAAITAGFDTAVDTHPQGIFGEQPPFAVAGREAVLHAAVLADRAAFRDRPAPPIEDLIAAAGLELRDGTVAAPGFDWDEYGSWQHRNRLRLMYGLDDGQVDLVQTLVDACDLHAEQGDAALGEPSERPGAGLALAGALDDADVTAAFTSETVQRGVQLSDLLAFAEALERHAHAGGARTTEGVTAVLVRCHTLLGDETRAVELLDAAVDTSSRHPHLLHLGAELAADRGRAAEARQLLLRAGVEPYDGTTDDPGRPWQSGPTHAQLLLVEVEPYARPRARRDIGRNSPCPCGSGKKYKACHLGKEEAPLVDRAPWLYEKCARHVRTRASGSLDDVAEEITHYAPHLYHEIAGSPILVDLVLHEHETDRDFIEVRGPLLPDDEQLLAAQWALVDRAVFEVEDVRRRPEGGELRLRDLATGDIVVVSQVHLGDQVRPGLVLLGRPLPVGDAHRAFSGFWPLDRSQVNAAIDAIAAGDPDALCAILASGLRPPGVTNTDGDPMEWHRITWSVASDPDTVAAVLTGAGVHGPGPGSEPGSTTWTVVRDSANQRNTVIASIEVLPVGDGTQLVVEVNSEERADELDELFLEWFPDAEVLDDDLLDLDEVRPPGEMASLDDPAVREMLEQHGL